MMLMTMGSFNMLMQKTLTGEFVPVGPHPDDEVVCSDGTVCRRSDALLDCRGGMHSCDEDRCEENANIVAELLDSIYAWTVEHVESDDYGDNYHYLVGESHHNWSYGISEWFDGHWFGRSISNDLRDVIEDAVGHAIYDSSNWEMQYDSNEYAAYSGSGCCLDSFGIGEYEEQIDLSCYDELLALHESGDLEDALDEYNGDLYIRRNHERTDDGWKETTYVHHGDCIYGYSSPGGQWRGVVSNDEMIETLNHVIIEYCRHADRNRRANKAIRKLCDDITDIKNS
jgi:hypothetical protein